MPFYKVVLIGEPAVGKTSIRRRFMGKSFETKYISTIGTELSFYESDKAKLQIWDLAGEPNFSAVRQTFYQGAAAVIAVVDRTRPQTLEALNHWFSEFKNILKPDVFIIMAANKEDLEDEAAKWVQSTEIADFITHHSDINLHTEAIPTSAKTGNNVDKLFSILIESVMTRNNLT